MITIPLEIERENLLKRVPFLYVLFEPTGKPCIWIPCAINGEAPVEYDYSVIEFKDPLEKVTDPWSRKSIQNLLPKDQLEKYKLDEVIDNLKGEDLFLANLLKDFFGFVKERDFSSVPKSSLIREFIG